MRDGQAGLGHPPWRGGGGWPALRCLELKGSGPPYLLQGDCKPQILHTEPLTPRLRLDPVDPDFSMTTVVLRTTGMLGC